MGSAWRYWRLVRLDASGRRRVEEQLSARAFFKAQFLGSEDSASLDDLFIQQKLWSILNVQVNAPVNAQVKAQVNASVPQFRAAESKSPSAQSDGLTPQILAELCLRCFISNQIEQVCIQLEAQFGQEHGFSRHDLFPFVLDDVIARQGSGRAAMDVRSSTTLAAEILRTFNPNQSSLAHWTTRLVKHHRDLNLFLLEQGIYLTSDWAILNDTSPKQLQRILTQYYHVSLLEEQQAHELLKIYHTVYRRDRLRQRQTGYRGPCRSPTAEQVTEMNQLLQQSNVPGLVREVSVISQLQYLAQRLRQYRIIARGGQPMSESLDVQQDRHALDQHTAVTPANLLESGDDQQEFLGHFRQRFIQALDQAIIQVCQSRIQPMQKRDPQAAEGFLWSLHLFHCQGKSMSEMAPLLSLKAQYQVSRLLKLKEFRADVCQKLLQNLKESTVQLAQQYAQPELLNQLEQQVQLALEEQINALNATAAAEASVPKNRPTASLFARRLCHVLRSQGWLKHKISMQEECS